MEIVHEHEVDEHIHADRRVRLRVRALRLPKTRSAPALAVEHSALPAGPTRAPVVLVHGFAQNRYTWRVSQRSLSGHLAAHGFDVWNLELRGHGNSRAYGAGNARAFAEYVDDLVRVTEAIGRPPFVIGHSLGGGVGVGASTRVPLAGLVHLAGLFAFATTNPFLRALAALTRRVSPVLRNPKIRVSTQWSGRLVSRLYGFTDATGYAFPVSGWAPGSVERDLLDERLRLGFDWTSLEVWREMADWALGAPFPYAEAFAGVDVPLLVLAGDADTLLTPADARRCYEASGAKDKSFVLFEPFDHKVHWGHLDLVLGKHAPDEVWPVITRWMQDRG